jgi:PiT family inorganic phosphate transporter
MLKDKRLFEEPPKDMPPPLWVRAVLILTCTSVSFSHGSNDGQKGVGLIMIILISIVPAFFAIDHSRTPAQLTSDLTRIEQSMMRVNASLVEDVDKAYSDKIIKMVNEIQDKIEGKQKFVELEKESHFTIRKDMLQISKKYNTFLDDMDSEGKLKLNRSEYKDVKSDIKKLAGYTQYSPWWVILMISVSLGLGTMVGWRRIVVTIGEKIGKSHLTYAQGASAELVAASTIGISTWLGLPVSTTHVLSSGVAGTMVAGKGLKNLRAKTVKSIAIAWLVTLPVTILLSGGLFLAMYYLIG